MNIRFNRRTLLLTVVAAGVAGLVWHGSLAHAQDTAAPLRGGILTGKLSGDPSSFDVVSSTSSLTLSVIGPCYNGLVMFDPLQPDKVIGDLATSWTEEDGGKRYVFKLVQNATFHDGKPLTSEDVRYSFDLMRNPPEGKTSSRKDLLEVIDKIEAPNPYEVVFTLKRPSVSFLGTLAIGWMLVMPKHVLEANNNELKEVVIGSGPFKLQSYTRGVSVDLVRNENYHVPERPYLDRIKLFIVPDLATVFANIRTGQLLFWDNIEGNDARRAQKEMGDKIVIQTAVGLSTEGVSLNTRREPWSDVRVRRAVSLAVDRGQSINVILGGDGIVGGLMPPGPWELPKDKLATVAGYGPDTNANREEAKKLLKEAGVPEGFSTVITARKAGVHEARAIFMQDQLSQIGISAKVDLQESAAYFDNVEAGNFEILTDGLGAGINDPDAFFGDFHTCEGSRNQSKACDPAVDAMYAEQRATTDPASRRALVEKMELASLDQFGWIGLYWKTRYLAYSSRVHGMVVHPQPDNARRLQDIWLSVD